MCIYVNATSPKLFFKAPWSVGNAEVGKRSAGRVSLINWCFKPSQPQRIISGLRETLIERYIVERASKAEIRPEVQSEKAGSCRENLRN